MVRRYLFITWRDKKLPGGRIASFRIMHLQRGDFITIKVKLHGTEWETYAPLIVEHVVNEYKVKSIYLDVRHGN